MRRYVSHLLAENYRTETAADGEQALEMIKNRKPDLVLTDVMMPRLDGFGLLKEIRSNPQNSGLPIIMLSARAGEESRVQGMQLLLTITLSNPLVLGNFWLAFMLIFKWRSCAKRAVKRCRRAKNV